MARAYSCDRCGQLFRREDFAATIPVVLENGNSFGIDFGNSNTYISLCPRCRAKFQKWWDEGSLFKTTEIKGVTTLYEVDENDQ